MAKRGRILILNERDPLHPQAGGVEVHVAEISRRLTEMGYEITQLATGFAGAAPRERVAGMDVRRLGPLAGYYPRAAWTCMRETRQDRYDLVVEHLCKVPFCAAAYSGVPVLAVSHHLFGRSAFLQVAWPIASAVIAVEALIPAIYRKLPFLAVSESSRDDLVARGIALEHIELLYNGISFPASEPRPWAGRGLRAAYFGRLEPYKRIDVFLRAMAQLVDRFPELEVLVIGDGSDRARLERLAAQLEIGARTRFAGFVTDLERDELLESARVCVCPSVKEGWGISVVEASARGTPTVATHAPGLVDAVRHEETGLLVRDQPRDQFVPRIAEAVARLLSDESLAGRLSREGIEWSARFTWDDSAAVMARAVDRAMRAA